MKTIVLEYDGRAFVPQEAVSLPAGYQATLEVEEVDAQNEVGSGENDGPMAAILKVVDELNAKFPPDPDTPRDLSTQHDHYLYGTPKRPENDFTPL